MSPDDPITPAEVTSPSSRTVSRRVLLAGAGAGAVTAIGAAAQFVPGSPASAQLESTPGGATPAASPVTGASPVAGATPTASTSELRITTALNANWKFVQDDNLTDKEALSASGNDWETVNLPHTWNANDAASLNATGYKRGLGWYRLALDTPSEGVRHWLEFNGASMVADVWLNGEHLGQHRGSFTTFRFDVTDHLTGSGTNDLVVKCNNSSPEAGGITEIEPLNGDFNVSGGLYRTVALVSTIAPVHFALDDAGGSGVYATTTSITDGNATVGAIAKVASDADSDGDFQIRISLVDDTGVVGARTAAPVTVAAHGAESANLELLLSNAHLWQGTEDPYLYNLVAEVLDSQGGVIDRVVQQYGVREMRFDGEKGFFLNGKHVRLNGVAMHQDFLGKAWAMTHDDMDLSLALIQEIGANAVRLGHYPFDRYVIQRADELGLVLWAEKPNGQKTTMDPCSDTTLSRPFVENARAQLQELIFQQFNHPSIAVWAVGNESDFGLLSCNDPVDTVRPYLQELGDLAKQLDPGRSTGYAEFGHPVQRSGYADTQEITDVFGTNRYFYWYSSNYQDLGPTLDGLHANAPDQALAITEYGIGAALSHHTDNPLGGYPDVRSVAEGQTAWQPEEFAAYAHEFNYKTFAAREYLFGTFVWNMFDFGSGHRREGDVLGVNTKGLVTFDRQTRKEPFFFYQANWSTAPVVHIVGHRYTDRAYAVNDIKVYSNADSVELLVNGTSVGTMKADEADFMTYVFPGVRLNVGDNTVTAQGDFSGKVEADTVTWTLANEDVNIAAGMLATGLKSSEGDVFGSDNYFTGGTYVTGKSRTVTNTNEPDLYFRFRQGTFGYEIPLDDGPYGVKLGFIEPYEDTTVGERIFSVAANGKTVIEDLDPRDEAGDYRRVIIKEFTVDAVDGLLRLSFVPTRGQAVVSTIMVKRA